MRERLKMVDVEDWLSGVIAETEVVADALCEDDANHGPWLILERIIHDMQEMKTRVQEAKHECP